LYVAEANLLYCPASRFAIIRAGQYLGNGLLALSWCQFSSCALLAFKANPMPFRVIM
ncbi:hypothetical protein L914_19792, partial [Phytophthora nicotianae]